MIRDRLTPDVDPANIRWPEELQIDPAPVRTWRRPVAIALGAAAVLAICLSAAFADQLAYTDTPGGEQVGVLRYVNELTFATETAETTIQTPHGPLVVLTTRTQNNLCDPACPDMLEVVRAPDGLIAVPGVVEMPEGGAVPRDHADTRAGRCRGDGPALWDR